MQLPNEIKLLIASVVTYAVTQGLKSLSAKIGFDLSGNAAFIAASLVGVVVVFSDSLLAAVPAEYQGSVSASLGLFVALLGAFGIHKSVSKG